MNTGRANSAGGGTQTAAIGAGGYLAPNTLTGKTETYDGTSWTETGDLATARFQMAGAKSGSTSAFLGCAGKTTANVSITEEFNVSTNVITGAAWAAGGVLGTGRYLMGGFGTPTTAVAAAGNPGSGSVGNVEEYNGSSWSEVNNVGTARNAVGSAGTLTAGIIFGGQVPSWSAVTEEYDGTNWTTNGALNTARGYNGGAGTQTAALSMGGYTGSNITNVEKYDGSTWTNSTVMPNGGRQFATSGAGTQTAALSAGVLYTSGAESQTYEFDGSSWTAGNAMNTARYGGGMAGTQSDMKYFSGSDDTKSVENYDGTTWVTDASLATLKYNIGPAAAGTADTAFGFGGGPPAITASEQYTAETSVATASTLTTS